VGYPLLISVRRGEQQSKRGYETERLRREKHGLKEGDREALTWGGGANPDLKLSGEGQGAQGKAGCLNKKIKVKK